jgi:hypothetical protein
MLCPCMFCPEQNLGDLNILRKPDNLMNLYSFLFQFYTVSCLGFILSCINHLRTSWENLLSLDRSFWKFCYQVLNHGYTGPLLILTIDEKLNLYENTKTSNSVVRFMYILSRSSWNQVPGLCTFSCHIIQDHIQLSGLCTFMILDSWVIRRLVGCAVHYTCITNINHTLIQWNTELIIHVLRYAKPV